MSAILWCERYDDSARSLSPIGRPIPAVLQLAGTDDACWRRWRAPMTLAGSGYDGEGAALLMFGRADDNDSVRYPVGCADAPHRIGWIGADAGSDARPGAPAATKVA
jgi:hypothetical protein